MTNRLKTQYANAIYGEDLLKLPMPQGVSQESWSEAIAAAEAFFGREPHSYRDVWVFASGWNLAREFYEE